MAPPQNQSGRSTSGRSRLTLSALAPPYIQILRPPLITKSYCTHNLKRNARYCLSSCPTPTMLNVRKKRLRGSNAIFLGYRKKIRFDAAFSADPVYIVTPRTR